MKQLRINPRRLRTLVRMLEQKHRFSDAHVYRPVLGAEWRIKLDALEVIIVDDWGRVFATQLTPRVQSFLSRVPLSADDDDQSSSADSDTASPQTGGDDCRCEDEGQLSVCRDSSSAVGPDGLLVASSSSASEESEANGQAQADSRETGEHQPGSSPDAGASEQGGVQAEQTGAAEAAAADAPAAAEGTGDGAQTAASSLLTGEVPFASAVEAAAENKGLNPFMLPSLVARREHGGVFARLSDSDVRPSRELIHCARAVFGRMLRGGEGAPGARWSAPRVAVKTAGYLRQWSVGDRRLEDGRPAILVLSDVSGSMASFARDVLAFAVAVSRIGLPGGEIVAVAQSNGIVEEILEGGRLRMERASERSSPPDVSLEIYKGFIRKYDVRAIVLAADDDGRWIYQQLYSSSTAHFYWLHAYSSRRAERVRVVHPGHHLWPKWASPDRLSMAYGCGMAERALEAMEMLLRLR